MSSVIYHLDVSQWGPNLFNPRTFRDRNKNIWSRWGDSTALCYTRFTLFILVLANASKAKDLKRYVLAINSEKYRLTKNEIVYTIFLHLKNKKTVWGRGGERRRRLRNFQTFSWASPSVQRRLWPPNNQARPLQFNLNFISQMWNLSRS